MARVGDSPANALGPDVQWPAVRGIRREVLAELATLAPGTAADPDSIRERLGWRRPLRPAGPLSVAIDGVLREAEWLGVTGRGAISSPGRALLGITDPSSVQRTPEPPEPLRHDGVAAAMTPHLPQPVDHILVQADLTAVAPGPLEGRSRRSCASRPTIESRGGATVHRFTP